jgi:hypothetical protein
LLNYPLLYPKININQTKDFNLKIKHIFTANFVKIKTVVIINLIMGNFGSSIGLKTAEKLSQETLSALDKLKISESTQNLTQTIERLTHPPGPIDFRVELDISDDVARLASMFFVVLCLGLFVALVIVLICWRTSIGIFSTSNIKLQVIIYK